MKPSSLSVKKLLRAIAAPVMLASTLLSGSFASADEVWASGVTSAGGWTDYNKTSAPGDNNLCWAAASSNVINHWQNRYWIEDSTIPTGEDIWTKFKQSVSYDAGGSFGPAFQWWLTGDYEGDVYGRYYYYSGDVIATDIDKFAGYYFDTCDLSTDYSVNPDNYERLNNSFWSVSHNTTGSSHMASKIVEQLKTGATISLSIGDDGSLAHAITLWGVEYEEVDGKANVTRLWLVDSDDEQYDVNPQGLFDVTVTTDEYGNITFDDYWGNVTGKVYISSATSINLAETDTWLYRLYKTSTADDVTAGNLLEGRGACVLQNAIIVSGASSEIMPTDSESRIYVSADSSKPKALGFRGATHRLFAVGAGKTLQMKKLGNLQFHDNASSGYGVMTGETDSEIALTDNQKVEFRGNTDGGAIAAYHLSIRNNGSVLFEKNLVNGTVLRGISADGTVELSAAKGQLIEFRDPIYLSSTASLSLNAAYTGTGSEPVVQSGDILFTGEYTEAALKEMLGKSEVTAQELKESRTSEILTSTSLNGGRLRVESGAIFRGKGLEVLTGSGATVLLKNATLDQTGCAVTFNDGTTLELSGCNTMSGNLDLQAGSTVKVSLTAANHNTAVLTYTSGSISLSESGTKLELLLDEDAEYGSTYRLIDGASNKYSTLRWNLVLAEQPTYFDWDNSLTWNGSSLLFNYDVMDPVWNNASGNSCWDANSANWEENGQNGVYRDNSLVRFGDVGAGVVSLVGTLKPYSVTVENSAGKDYTWQGSGKLAGSMQLTKKGAGVLTINCGNEYTGGTVVESGKLVVGQADALGTGKVSLKGGILDLNGTALANAIEVQGSAEMNGGSSYLGGLTLTSGALTGEQINLAQTLELRSGSIANKLSGAAGVIKLGDGTATLSGNNTYSGKTTVSAGTMVMATADSLGSGDVVVNGGTLKAEQGMTIGSGQKLTLAGGALAGDVSLEGEMDVTTEAVLTGSLTLNGGQVTFHKQVLSITGNLVLDSASTFDVSCWKELGVYRAMMVGGVSGNLEDISLISNSRNTYTLFQHDAYVMLGVENNPQTIYWTSGEGTWTVKGTDEWAAAPGETLVDPYFYNLDEVVFAQGGRVTIEGEVEPGRVMVSGDEALYLSGSGSITGAGSLHKSGDGVLEMNAANSYSGGTVIDGGLVIAGGSGSFGSGDICLNGGELNLGDYAVENDITATGGMLSASAYRGKLVVNGHLQIGPETRAESIVLESGSIGGAAVMARMARMAAPAASIIDTPVEAVSGSIDVDLLGSTSLLVHKAAVVVSGDNSYTGGTVVQSGSLEVAAGSSLGSGPISLMGGILKAATGLSLLPGQQMTMNGGHVEGALRTSAGSVLAITPGSRISGDLTLGGGSICFNYGTSSWNATGLTIGGNLAVDEVTGIVVSGTYTQDSVLMSFDSLTGDMSKLVLLDEEGELSETLKLTREDNSIVLRDINSTTSGGGSQNWNYDPAVLNDMLAQASWGMFHGSHAFVNAMQGEKFSGSQVGTGATVWVAAMHAFASQDSKGTHAGSDISHTGGALGYEMLVGDASCIGMALGMMSGEVQTEGSTIEMNQDSTYIGLYGATRLHGTEKSAVTLSAYAAYGFYETSPAAQYANMDWSQNAVQLNVRVDGSRELGDSVWGNVFAGLEYFCTTDDTTEGIATGELMNMRAEIGAGVTYQTSKLVLHAEAAFLCDVARDNPTPTINGVSGSAANPGRVGASISGGAAYNILPSWSVSANANAEFVDGASSCSVNVGTAVRF